jgi:hypothetical protein
MPPRSSTTSGKPAAGAKAGKAAARKTSGTSFATTSGERSAKPRATRPAAATPRREAKKAGLAPPEERMRLIAEAAYFKAEQRGFAEGGELGDWIEAEAEIDALLDSRGAG